MFCPDAQPKPDSCKASLPCSEFGRTVLQQDQAVSRTWTFLFNKFGNVADHTETVGARPLLPSNHPWTGTATMICGYQHHRKAPASLRGSNRNVCYSISSSARRGVTAALQSRTPEDRRFGRFVANGELRHRMGAVGAEAGALKGRDTRIVPPGAKGATDK
jgi:hypothetical protein